MDESHNAYINDLEQLNNLFTRNLQANVEFKNFKQKENLSESTFLMIMVQIVAGIFFISNVIYFTTILKIQSLIYLSISQLTLFGIFNMFWIIWSKLCKKKSIKQVAVLIILSFFYISLLTNLVLILSVNDQNYTFDDLTYLTYPIIIIGSSLIFLFPYSSAFFTTVIISINLLTIILLSINYSQYSNTLSMIMLIFYCCVIFYIGQNFQNKILYDNFVNHQKAFRIFSMFNSSITSLNCSSFVFKNHRLLLTTKKANELLTNSANNKNNNTFTSQKMFFDNNVTWNRQSSEVKLQLTNSPISSPISNRIILPKSILNIKKLFKSITPFINLTTNPNHKRNLELILMCGLQEHNASNHGMEVSNFMYNNSQIKIKNSNLYKIIKKISKKNHEQNCECFALTSKFLNIGMFRITPKNYVEVLVKTEIYNDDIIVSLIFNQQKEKPSEITEPETRNNSKVVEVQKLFKKQVHEFKTPLISIVGSCEQLQKEINEKDTRNVEFLMNHIINISNYIKFLIKDILSKERSTVDFTLVNKKTKLNNILHFCSDILISLLNCDEKKSKNIIPKLLNHISSLNLSIVVDEIRLKQILLNFISNSVKFTNSGEIVIKSSLSKKDGNILKISVKDTGVGIKNEFLEVLNKGQSMEQFNVEDKNNQFGTGLGLCIAQTLLKKMNMKFQIKSFEHIGTKITISIPINETEIYSKFSYEDKSINQSDLNSSKNINSSENHIIIIPSRASTEKCLNMYKKSNFDVLKRSRSNSIKETNKIDVNVFEEELDNHKSIDEEIETKINSKLNGIEYSDLPLNFECEILRTTSSNVVSPGENIVRINNRNFTFKEQTQEFISSINKIKNNININFTTNEYKQEKDQNQVSLNEKILVIDDLKIPRISLANNIKNILIQNSYRYDILEGSDGIDCLKYLMDYHKLVKFIFIDENMTYMNGTETAKIVRSFNSLGIDPVIVLISANDNEIDGTLFDTALVKPVEKVDLMRIFEKYNIISRRIKKMMAE